MIDILMNQTITLYNHHEGKWRRTVLEGVQWVEKNTKVMGTDGALKIVPEISITIPDRKGFVHPKEYAGLGFTFGLENLDVIVLGECPAEITEKYTITDLKKEYPDAATITTYKDNTRFPYLQHWKVSARC